MAKPRSPLAVTLSVWEALFLREALDRLFDMRAAWFWLLMEPVLHIGFIAFVFSAIRIHTVGGIDIAVWIIVGMLAFFLFRRTAVQVTYAPESNQPLFAYRQVKPFDVSLVRAGLEAFLMVLVSAAILGGAALLGHETFPRDPLLVAVALSGLWLYGLGYGLVASVLMELVPETEHILKLIMLPLYLISGVIMPLISVPQPYRDWLMLNPIAHGLELVRLGFVPYYHVVPGTSMGYLYGWAGGSVLLGLLLYRRFALELVTK
ncbi:ABC transporter permease [Bordetella pseudohinzii]|uniref:Transport permease protein n=2 Tax=Bordetella pseudohinzii TaxID=1331258 RepID=A0A0J6C5N8_9BORD|nr:ABC transporter permease [Bordetella pseudohinzii]ANY15038.1 ABC transporter [Bordetella pseudohinzii]KMM26076.1 ABC transporter [Bordetella pseudohinzii]KXA79847.1 ABC transporter [Bordetella pseudohinzii]KXA82811.1 ABC transporter [Bordetella pseudohinzii]CUI53822.1 Polysialic acid transport protein kpsM [Bordetella pseudohinzii]